MLKRILTALYHFTWYTFAFIVLTAAVLVTVMRLALPEIGGYKEEIQSWVSEYMDYPVVIGEISAEWQGWTPHLYLKDIDLYTPDNSTLISNFEAAHLGIDPFASINQRELVPSKLSISGLSLEFTRNENGSMSINHSDNNNLKSNTDNNALSVWLLKQNYIAIENASLIWHDKKQNKEPLEFSNARLVLKTQNERVQIDAYITLPDHHGQSLTMKMDMFGNILTPDWKGQVYIEAKDVNPQKLLEGYTVKSSGGIANARLWTNWEKSKLIDINGKVNYTNFSLETEQISLPINNIDLSFSGKRSEEKDWLLNVSIDDLQTQNGLWPASSYQINAIKNNVSNNYEYSGYLSYLKLQEIIPLLVATNVIPKNVLEKIDWYSLQGDFTNTSFVIKPETEDVISIETEFKGLDIALNDKQHAANNLQGSLVVNNNETHINLLSNSSEILINSIFEKPFSLSKFQADLEVTHSESIELLFNEVYVEDSSITAKMSGAITFDKEKPPFIDIVAHVDETNIENLPGYLPKQTPANLKRWFSQALIGGKLLSADLIYHGYTADFPFENSEGNFKSILNVENASISYGEHWPPVDQLTAEVIIDNDDLYVSSSSAYIFDATINDFKANIKKLSVDDPHVIVSGSINGHTSDAGNFIKQSPLNENVSLRELTENIYGGISVKIDLDIPLASGQTSIDGIVSFTDTTIESKLPGLGLEGVNGDVYFTRDATWASDIDALYHGKPVKLNIPKFDRNETDSESYIISGVADKDFFITELTSFFPTLLNTAHEFSDKFSGKSKWSLTLSKSNYSDSRQVEFNSDLKGISIDLPYPIRKMADEHSPLSIKTSLSDLLIKEININYGNNIYADFNVDNTKDLIVKSINIGLGQQHPIGETTNDLSIQGHLESLDVSDWIGFINPSKTNTIEKETTAKAAKKEKIINGHIQVQKLNMLGNVFNDINISLDNQNNGWQVLFDSEEIKGQTNFIASDNNRLKANFEKFTLKKSEDSSGDDNENQIAIEKIPELEVNIDSFIYDNNELGQLNLLTNNVPNGININNLSITKPGFSIKATGEWTRIDEIDRSDFHAILETDTIENMLSTFSFESANIKDGQTTIEMNAYWMDTPMNFSMEEIDGELDMKIAKGSFLDINPSAGRLFGLLSIQALPRRLTLDFSDLFEEGFAFDSIEGNFSLQQGHAYTNNLEMTGPSADIIVSGRTGLSTEDYDQIATVTPKISSGLPVASALFGPVGVGVGAVFYIAGEIFDGIPKKIDQILSAQYTITGSWEDPNIEKIVTEAEKSSG
jgi:uncharacterized protein (TIGR02099 family)